MTVVLNSYNQCRYLPEAIESVLSQTFDDWELIIVDNGSTDGSREVLEVIDDPRVRVLLHDSNEPISRRFNEAVQMARGRYISFLYSDDLLAPGKLALQVERLDRLGPSYGVAYGPPTILNDVTGARWVQSSVGVSGQVLRSLLRDYRRGQIDMVSPLTRRDCLLGVPFNEEVFAEGESIFLLLAVDHLFVFHAESVAVLRDHAANAGKALQRNCDMTMASIDRLASHERFPRDHEVDLDRYRRSLLRSYGWQAVRLGGDAAWGRACLRSSTAGRPSAFLDPKVLIGIGLSVLPDRVRATFVSVVARLRRSSRNEVLVADYEGLG